VPFEGEEPALGLAAGAAGVAAELAVHRHHPVTGNDERDRVAAASQANRAGRAADQGGHGPIGHGLAVGDAAHGVPDLLLVRRRGRGERQLKVAPAPVQVFQDLVARALQERPLATRRHRRRVPPIKGDDGALVGLEGEGTEGAGEGKAFAHPGVAFSAAVRAAASVRGREQVVPTQT